MRKWKLANVKYLVFCCCYAIAIIVGVLEKLVSDLEEYRECDGNRDWTAAVAASAQNSRVDY